MVKEIVSNITGVFILNNGRIIEKKEYTSLKELQDKNDYEQSYLKKYPVVKTIISPGDKNLIDRTALRALNTLLTKQAIQDSITEDQFIIQTTNTLDDLTKVTNGLTKRLREWYALHLPELSEKITINETFVEAVLTTKKQQGLKELYLEQSMGKTLTDTDLQPILVLAHEIQSLSKLQNELLSYLE